MAKPLSFKDFIVVDYRPGMGELINYRATKRRRLGEEPEVSEEETTDEALDFQARRARARSMKKNKAKITKNKELETQKALGEGDIPIVGIMGGLLGIQLGVSAIFLAALLALVPAIYNLFSKEQIETAFIPFLSLGLLITLITQFNIFLLFVG